MSEAISEESLQHSRYKTIVSQQKTRHPTTIKKKLISPTQFQRSYYQSPFIQKIKKGNAFKKKAESLRESLVLLEYRKMRYIEEDNYKKALEVNRHISRTKSLLTQAQLKRLNKDQINENKSIKSAYQHEIKYFEHAWSRYFQSSREKERDHLDHFEQDRARAIDQTRTKLARKCHSLRNKSAQIIQLEKEESYYKQKGDVQHLSLIKIQKSKIKERLKKQRQSLIMKWTKDEEMLINRKQSKKYQILIKRLKEQRKDQQRAYHQQKHRLKQKFMNVMSQLKHQQKMILNFANIRIDQIKIS